ncbi:lactonase family protein, partial [Streptomyces sp. SID6648]|nr:lactonase family protein [Streptomyces sp. SID6648]
MKPSPHPYSGPERSAPGLPALPGRRGFLGGLLATAALAAAGPAL